MSRRCVFVLGVLAFLLGLSACIPATTNQKRRSRALLRLGIAESNQGHFRRALALLIQAEDLEPRNYWLQEALGGTYMRMGHFSHALIHYKRAVDINPKSPRGWNNVGTAHMALKQWKGAVSALRKAVDNLLYQTPCIALANLGWAYQKTRHPKEAVKYLNRSLKECPRLCQGHRLLGKTHYANGRFEPARRSFYLYTKYCKKYPEGFYLLARTQLKLKLFEDAVRASRQCLDLTKESPTQQRVCGVLLRKAQTRVARYVP